MPFNSFFLNFALMKQLHLFNPDNDLALASGLDFYTSPPLAAQLRRDLQMLPAWWANPGDYVLTQNRQIDADWTAYLHDNFGIEVELIDKNHLQNHQFVYRPWGWNASLRNQLLACCVPASQLPSPKLIEQWRQLSHRRSSVAIHHAITDICRHQFCSAPIEIIDLASIAQFADTHYRCFLKAPWSSSGKGIFRPTDTQNLTFDYWARGILQRQGSVIGELPFDKILDFAMEFNCVEGKAHFTGYSVYYNNQHNAFDTGIAASENRLHRIICQQMGEKCDEIATIRTALEEILTTMVAQCYNGYLGIDMLLFRHADGSIGINPCVEMNLRTTMGVLTSVVGSRFVHPDSIGLYHCEYHKAPFDVEAYMQQKIAENPPIFEQINGTNRIKKGTMLMAPVYPDSRYCAYIDVEEVAEP